MAAARSAMRSVGVTPQLYVYGAEGSVDRRVAEAICEGEGLELDAIDKGVGVLKYDYLSPPRLFVSNGPQIVDWSCLNRDCVVHAENYDAIRFLTEQLEAAGRTSVKSLVLVK